MEEEKKVWKTMDG